MGRCEWTAGRHGSGRRRGVGRRARAIAVSIGVLALQSPFAAPHAVVAAHSVAPSPSAQSCAWPWVVGVQNFNRAFPDSAEFYYSQPIVAGASARVTITGTYPNARYFALQVYTPYGNQFNANGAGPSLPDYRIAPAPGSINPWQHRAAPGGRFEVTIASKPAPGESNVLPMPPGTSALHPGYLLYRVYLPAGGTASHLTLPTITFTQGSTSRTLPLCRTHSPVPYPEKAPARTAPAGGAKAPPPPGAFFKPNFQGGAANADTAYVWAYIVHSRAEAADVVVVTAKAPTFAPGSSPSPWPAPGEDMRYWSMCVAVGTSAVPTVVNKLPGGQTDYGCRADEATKLDAAGYYFYVVGPEAQRAAISRVPGATFLPFSSTQATPLYLVLLRYLLVRPSFKYSVQDITKATDAPAASAAMGPYYPRAAVCALSTLVARGPQACLRHP